MHFRRHVYMTLIALFITFGTAMSSMSTLIRGELAYAYCIDLM